MLITVRDLSGLCSANLDVIRRGDVPIAFRDLGVLVRQVWTFFGRGVVPITFPDIDPMASWAWLRNGGCGVVPIAV